MENSLLFVLFFAVAFAGPVAQNEADDDCSIVWITVDGNGPKPSATTLSSSSVGASIVTSSAMSFSASDTISTSASQNKIVDTSSSSQAPSPRSDTKGAQSMTSASTAPAAAAPSGTKQNSLVSMPTRPNGDAGHLRGRVVRESATEARLCAESQWSDAELGAYWAVQLRRWGGGTGDVYE